ncbi:MAG TPA: ABC transporter permease DevC [Gemmataceae bacterium]|jgi:putative ABC transport system permease protein
MLIFSRVPLPWLNLTHDKWRLFFRVMGTAFAVLLLFVELGFWNALQEAPVQLIQQFNGPLIIVSQAHYALNIKETFPRRRLIQARAVAGVQHAFPVYFERPAALWKDTSVPEDQRTASQPIRVIAFHPDEPVLNNDEVNQYHTALRVPYNILLDRKSKEKNYGQIQAGIDRELAGYTVYVVGLFTLGTDFANDGNAIMSAETYARLFGGSLPSDTVLEMVDMGVVQIAENADVQTVYRSLQQVLPKDVRVFTKEEFVKREKAYWGKTTPMGFIFFLGMCVGFIVGAVICYQIISADVSGYLPQFATLKAMGYSDAFLNGVVLREALWLAVLGFVPGWGLSWLLYRRLTQDIGLPMHMTVSSVLLVAFFTILMCVVSGLLALSKVRTADPAEVFA